MMMSDKCIVWFRQDLRIRDNLTLQYCKDRNVRILPIFIFDPDIDIGSCSKYWLFHILKSMNESLNDSLFVFCGSTTEILEKLLETGEYQEISWNKMYDEKSLKLENQINKISIKHRVKSFIYNSNLIIPRFYLHIELYTFLHLYSVLHNLCFYFVFSFHI